MTPEKRQQLYDSIRSLREQNDVLILAHLYENLDIQHIADFCGDSFELAKKAKASPRQNIVFCGVTFMGESAKILCPDKRVFLPRTDAGCAMADMVTPADIRALRAAHPEAAVVCYINSSAAVKAECDMCVTSSNALAIVSGMPQKEILFVPDKNLGAYIAARVPDKRIHLYHGFCPVHRYITTDAVHAAKALHPIAELLVHPECEPDVVALADFAGSTSAIISYAKQSDKTEFIIGTERAVYERLAEECPEKKFYLLAETLICPDMKKTTLEDLHRVMAAPSPAHEVTLDESVMNAARRCLERMLQAGSVKNK